MRAAFLASDFRLDGMGLLTADTQKDTLSSSYPCEGSWGFTMTFEFRRDVSRE